MSRAIHYAIGGRISVQWFCVMLMATFIMPKAIGEADRKERKDGGAIPVNFQANLVMLDTIMFASEIGYQLSLTNHEKHDVTMLPCVELQVKPSGDGEEWEPMLAPSVWGPQKMSLLGKIQTETTKIYKGHAYPLIVSEDSRRMEKYFPPGRYDFRCRLLGGDFGGYADSNIYSNVRHVEIATSVECSALMSEMGLDERAFVAFLWDRHQRRENPGNLEKYRGIAKKYADSEIGKLVLQRCDYHEQVRDFMKRLAEQKKSQQIQGDDPGPAYDSAEDVAKWRVIAQLACDHFRDCWNARRWDELAKGAEHVDIRVKPVLAFSQEQYSEAREVVGEIRDIRPDGTSVEGKSILWQIYAEYENKSAHGRDEMILRMNPLTDGTWEVSMEGALPVIEEEKENATPFTTEEKAGMPGICNELCNRVKVAWNANRRGDLADVTMNGYVFFVGNMIGNDVWGARATLGEIREIVRDGEPFEPADGYLWLPVIIRYDNGREHKSRVMFVNSPDPEKTAEICLVDGIVPKE